MSSTAMPTTPPSAAGHLTGPLAAAQLSGAIPSASLSGTYPGAVTFNNAGNAFSGDGGGLTSLNASQLTSGTVPNARLAANVARTNQVWLLGGNAGTTPGTHFVGNTDNQFLDFRVDNRRALRLVPTGSNSVNVVGGWSGNYVWPGTVGATIGGGGAGNYAGTAYSNVVSLDFGTVGGGLQNFASLRATVGGGSENYASFHATVGGGNGNTAIGQHSTVAGGYGNTASGARAAVGGGWTNAAEGQYATVGGGYRNTVTAAGTGATLSGGQNNTVSNLFATVSGGAGNKANGSIATVGGGQNNTAGGLSSTVGGGEINNAAGLYATIPGGLWNTAGDYSFAAGRRAKANHQGAFVWADSQDADFASAANNEFAIRAQNGVRIAASGDGATVLTLSTERSWAFRQFGDGANAALELINYTGNKNFIFNTSGSVAIGTTAPAFNLHVNGTAGKPGGGSWSVASDARLKDAGRPFTRGLDALAQLAPRHYHYAADNPLQLPADRDYVGLIAQQVQAAIPEAIEPNATGYLHVNNDPILWTMLNGIKELNRKVETRANRLEQELKRRDTEITELNERLAKLEHLLSQLTSNSN